MNFNNHSLKFSFTTFSFSALLLVLLSCSKDKGFEVKTQKVSKRTIVQTVSAIGSIEPETNVKISSETSGELIYLGVKEGDTVRKNQVLARIKPDIIKTQLEQSQASVEAAKMDIEMNKSQLENAKITFDRTAELFKKEFVSKSEFDQAKAAFDQAGARHIASIANHKRALASMKQIQRSADRTTILSPLEGIVTSLMVEIGEKIQGATQFQGTNMMNVADLSVINAVVQVDENDIIEVKMGDTARVELDAFPNKKFDAYVIEIGHSARVNNAGSQNQITNFDVKLRLLETDPRIRSGMTCSVDIETKIASDVIAVPLQSVTVRANKERKIIKKQEDKNEKRNNRPQTVIFVKKGNTAIKKDVELGISDGGFIEITKGVEIGEDVISGPYKAVSKELYDNATLKTKTGDKAKKGKSENE